MAGDAPGSTTWPIPGHFHRCAKASDAVPACHARMLHSPADQDQAVSVVALAQPPTIAKLIPLCDYAASDLGPIMMLLYKLARGETEFRQLVPAVDSGFQSVRQILDVILPE